MTLVLEGRSDLFLDPVLAVTVNQENQEHLPSFSEVFEDLFKAFFTQNLSQFQKGL